MSQFPSPKTFLPKTISSGKIRINILEVNTLLDFRGKKTYMIAYNIEDYEGSRPIVTGVAHLFLNEPELDEKELARLSPTERRKLYEETFIKKLKEELMDAVRLYKANRDAFRRMTATR